MKTVLFAILVASIPVAAFGQDGTGQKDAAPPEIARLYDCRAIADPDARLACYDREVGNVMQAQASKELIIANTEQVKETRRGLFGFTLPKIGLFRSDDSEDEIKEIVSTVAQARQMSNGRYMLELEGGARWMQSDNTPILREIDRGEKVVIKKAALGSYLAKVGNRRAFRAKRVD